MNALRCVATMIALLGATLVPSAASAETGLDLSPLATDQAIDEIRDGLQGLISGERIGVIRVAEERATITVPIVDLAQSDRDKLSDLDSSHGLTVEYEATASSQALLDDLNAEVARFLVDRQAQFKGWGVGVNGLDNVVEVALSPDLIEQYPTLPEAVRDLAEQVLQDRGSSASLDDVLTIGEGQHTAMVGDEPLPEERDQPHARSGKWISIARSGICTIGWIMQSSSTYFASTAGHCIGPTRINDLVEAYNKYQDYGYSFRNSFGGSPTGKDLLAFNLSLSNYAHANPVVYIGGALTRPVVNKIYDSSQNIGQRYCHAGYGVEEKTAYPTGEVCNQEFRIYGHTANYDGQTVTNLNCLSGEAYGGDSGGPVYAGVGTTAQAAGLTTSNYSIGASNYTCYHVLDDVEAVLGGSVLIG